MREKKKISKIGGLAILGLVFSLFFSMAVLAAPKTPTGLKQASSSETSFKVEWTNDTTTGIRYEVQYSTDKAKWNTTTASGNSSYIYKLAAGKTYYFRARSYTYTNTNDKSAWSAIKTVVTTPKRVETITLKSAATTSVTLTWKAVSGANRYKVGLYSNGKDTKSYTSSTNSITIKGLKSGQRYTFRVYAQKAITGYTASQTSPTYIYDAKTVPTISGFKATNSYPSIKKLYVQWNRQDSADGYQAELQDSKGKKIGKTQTLIRGAYSTYFSGVSNTTFYKARVRGYVKTSSGNKYSAWKTIYVTNQPTPVVNKSGSTIAVSWSKVTGATSYGVYISTKTSSGYTKVGSTTSTKFSIKKCGSTALKKGKTYYVYIRAFKKAGSTTYGSGSTWVTRVTF